MGLTSLAASKYDLTSAAIGKKQMRILCVGHGGGSLPLFLANYILGRIFSLLPIYFASLVLMLIYLNGVFDPFVF